MPIFGGIFVGRRFGAFDSTPAGGRVDDAVGPSFPPAGSHNSTLYGQTYPIVEGGTYVTVDGYDYPNQNADVDVLNDGNGGTYIDWTTADNIVYKTGTFYNDGTPASNTIYIPELDASFTSFSKDSTDYSHDGFGGVSAYDVNGQYATGSYGIATGVQYNYPAIEVPYTSGNYFSPASSPDTEVFADGAGGYYLAASGGTTYHTGFITTGANYQTEVPSVSGNYYDNGTYPSYEWDGTGGYTTQTGGSYYAYGELITNDGFYNYYWDGNGGYYYL